MSESLEQRVLRERLKGETPQRLEGKTPPNEEASGITPDRGVIDGNTLARLNSIFPKGREHQSLFLNR